MKLTRLILMFVVLLVGNGCAIQPVVRTATTPATACPESTAALKRLTHAALGYCLLYAADYLAVESSDTTIDVVLGSIMNHTDPRVSLTVEEAAGRTLDQIADQVAADFTLPGVTSERTSITLAGEPAVLFDHLPGQAFNRRLIVLHQELLYHFFFTPVDPDDAVGDENMAAFYATITESFQFIPVVPGALVK